MKVLFFKFGPCSKQESSKKSNCQAFSEVNHESSLESFHTAFKMVKILVLDHNYIKQVFNELIYWIGLKKASLTIGGFTLKMISATIK